MGHSTTPYLLVIFVNIIHLVKHIVKVWFPVNGKLLLKFHGCCLFYAKCGMLKAHIAFIIYPSVTYDKLINVTSRNGGQNGF